MTDPRDALLAEAARLLRSSETDRSANWHWRLAEWLARYEEERAGRGDGPATNERIDGLLVGVQRDGTPVDYAQNEIARWLVEAEQRGAERERAACEKIAREHMQIRDGGITAAEGEGREEDAMLEASAFAAAEYIADAIAARTAPATPGKEDVE